MARREELRQAAAGCGGPRFRRFRVNLLLNLMGVGLIPAEAVADLAVMLAGERFRFTTGGFLTVDGGLAEGFPR